MTFIYSLFLIFGIQAFAETAQPLYHVYSNNPDIPVEQMSGPHVVTHRSGEPLPGSYQLPATEERDHIFSLAQLNSEISSWDQFARDKLYLSARDLKLEILEKNYPKLSSRKLKKLSDVIKQQKAEPQ